MSQPLTVRDLVKQLLDQDLDATVLIPAKCETDEEDDKSSEEIIALDSNPNFVAVVDVVEDDDGNIVLSPVKAG